MGRLLTAGRVRGGLGVLGLLAWGACTREAGRPATTPDARAPLPAQAARPDAPPPPWAGLNPPGPGEVLALLPGGAKVVPAAEARAAGLLDVDLGDEWAPFIFSESDGPEEAPKPNVYRKTFIDLANDRVDPDELYFLGGATRAIDFSPEAVERRLREAEARRRGKPLPPEPPRRKRTEPVRNYLEVFGIPPSLSVLLARIDEDERRDCYAGVDVQALRAWDGQVTYQSLRQVRREYDEALGDAAWVAAQEAALADAGVGDASAPAGVDAGTGLAALAALAAVDAKVAARLERHRRGQRRLGAVRAAQARLVCEGLLSTRSRFVEGMFDLQTHQALAAWERKNDVFGWGFLGGETAVGLTRAPAELHFETWKRIVTERLADGAGIIEDGSVGGGRRPATYKDTDGTTRPVPDLIGEHVGAFLGQLGIAGPEDLARFLRAMRPALGTLRVAFAPPPLPAYYPREPGADMDLEVEIDRGDVWYEFPFDSKGRVIDQRRDRFPHLTVFVRWNKQRIPLARWRTTIGSWRSELHSDGKVYYKYKNSDVGPRIWKYVVAAPVWVPPDGTPARDLLTRREFDRQKGPVPVVNTEVIGPGFQSAYGLVMAIHHKVTAGGGLFDNQIRTHGSVDYTSIARRFSHGCHRLVNTRAVRFFGFVLQRRSYVRQGSSVLGIKKFFTVDDQKYGYELTTRGYYYQLKRPIPVEVLEGRIMGDLKKPIIEYVRKPGVDYGPEVAVEGSAAPAAESPVGTPAESPVETAPVVGP